MSLKNKAKEMWEDPAGAIIVILVGYTPVPVFYIMLDSSWDNSVLYTSVWSFILAAFFWTALEWVIGFLNRIKEEESNGEI